MLKLHYKDLLHLRNILRKDQDAATDYLLSVVNQEIEKVPTWMIPLVARTQGSDIYLCTDREIEDRVRKLSVGGAPSNGFTMAIYCQHSSVAEFIYDRILSLIEVKSAIRHHRSITLPNSARIYIVSDRQANGMRGQMIDMAIVHVYPDGPSA